jgi:hypothetical protein
MSNPAQRLSVLLAASALAVSAPAHAFFVGSDPACTHTSIQAAIDAAAANGPGLDTIYVAGNQTYAGQALSIAGHDVWLRGGYSDCSASQPTTAQRTTLDGTGNGGNPVIRIDNAGARRGNIILWNLELTGGHVANGEGGGLRVEGNLQIDLTGVRLRANSALRGGGLYLKGQSETEPATLGTFDSPETGNASLIQDNQASDGGGLYGDESSRPQITLLVENNQAIRGGGLFLNGPYSSAFAYVWPTSLSGGGIRNNLASQDGGGVYMTNGATFETERTSPDQPAVELRGNRAGRHGGGLFAGSGTFAALRRVIVADDQSGTLMPGNGGGFYVAMGAYVLFDGVDPDMGLGTFCAQTLPCAVLSGNIAGNSQHTGFGGGAYVEHEGNLTMRYAGVSNNVADDGAAIWVSGGFPGNGANLYSVLMTGNTSPGAMLIAANGALLHLEGSTLAANPVGSLLRLDQAGAEVFGSILHQPDNPLLTTTGSSSVATQCVVASSDFDPTGDVRVDDPMFVDANAQNYRLAFGSPALDACTAFAGALGTYDYSLQPRGVDQPGVPDNGGPYDIGAFEMPLVPDEIFISGFESPTP